MGDGGCAVYAVAGGAEVLRLLATGAAVDALLTDRFMPGIRRPDLAHATRSDGRHPEAPNLRLTGAAEGAEAHRAPHQHQSVIQEPFTVATLVGALHEPMGVTRQGSA